MKFPVESNMQFLSNDSDISPRFYYSKILGPFYRAKLRILCNYLPSHRIDRIMEIGYGSGIALVELSRCAKEVYGLDIHDHVTQVNIMLRSEKVDNVRLFQHNIFENAFSPQKSFDYIVSSSVFEHLPSHRLKSGLEHISNLVKDDGYLLVGFPLKTVLMNSIFRFYETVIKKFVKNVYNFTLEDDHPSGENEILPELNRFFEIEDKIYFFNRWLKLYVVLKCKKKKIENTKAKHCATGSPEVAPAMKG